MASQQGPLPSIYDLSPPHGAITDSNHGAYVVIVTWIFMCFMTLSVGARLLTRVIPVRTQGKDDYAIAIAMIIAIIQSVLVHVSVNHGLGQHIEDLSKSNYDSYSKLNYAAGILFILALFTAKLSMLLFIMRLTPSVSTLRACYVVIGIVSAWAFSISVALARQCDPPRSWDFSNPSKCLDQSALNYAAGVIDILTDMIIILLPAIIVWNVQISRRQRWTVIGVFAARITVCICQALRLSSLHPWLNGPDKTWNNVTPQSWTEIVQSLSIITACIPCLRPFLSSLESGLLDSTMRTHVNKTYGSSHSQNRSGGNSYALHSFNSSNERRGNRSRNDDFDDQILADEDLKKDIHISTVSRNGSSSRSSTPGKAKDSRHHPTFSLPRGISNAEVRAGRDARRSSTRVDNATPDESESTRGLTTSSQSGRIDEEEDHIDGIRTVQTFRVETEPRREDAMVPNVGGYTTGGMHRSPNNTPPKNGSGQAFGWED